ERGNAEPPTDMNSGAGASAARRTSLRPRPAAAYPPAPAPSLEVRTEDTDCSGSLERFGRNRESASESRDDSGPRFAPAAPPRPGGDTERRESPRSRRLAAAPSA